MITKISSKHQITIPKKIAEAFHLKKGDVMEIVLRGDEIVMSPKEVIYEDKYLQSDLQGAENALSRGLPKEEIAFESAETMIRHLEQRKKK